jgi:hypothetical protein
MAVDSARVNSTSPASSKAEVIMVLETHIQASTPGAPYKKDRMLSMGAVIGLKWKKIWYFSGI